MKLSLLHEAVWHRVTGGAMFPDPLPTEVTDDPGIWYHGTSSVFLDNIVKNGLRPTGKATELYLTRHRKLSTFSAHRAVERFGGDPIVFEANTKDLDIELRGTPLDSSTTGAIPPENLRQLRVRKKR